MIRSGEELVQATHQLIAIFDSKGIPSASRELREGFAALNGLTDGWALFLESVKKVEGQYASQLSGSQRAVLAEIHGAAYQAVYRRRLKPWWRFW
ncbi:MAG: hypothetical protein AB1898_03490 [Acidobacteriota bacterium]